MIKTKKNQNKNKKKIFKPKPDGSVVVCPYKKLLSPIDLQQSYMILGKLFSNNNILQLILNYCGFLNSNIFDSGDYNYLIFSDIGTLQLKLRTYIGYTNRPKRRIKQHNCILKSRITKSTITSKYCWRYVVIVGGHRDRRSALSFEWHWKHARGRYYSGPMNRFLSLRKTLERFSELNLWIAIAPQWYDYVLNDCNLIELSPRVRFFSLPVL